MACGGPLFVEAPVADEDCNQIGYVAFIAFQAFQCSVSLSSAWVLSILTILNNEVKAETNKET